MKVAMKYQPLRRVRGPLCQRDTSVSARWQYCISPSQMRTMTGNMSTTTALLEMIAPTTVDIEHDCGGKGQRQGAEGQGRAF